MVNKKQLKRVRDWRVKHKHHLNKYNKGYYHNVKKPQDEIVKRLFRRLKEIYVYEKKNAIEYQDYYREIVEEEMDKYFELENKGG